MKSVAEDVFSYFDQPASAWGGEEAKLHLIQRASLRALVIFRLCPSLAEEIFSKHKDVTEHWVSLLVEEASGPEAVYMRNAVTELSCLPVAPQLCSLKHKIEAARAGPDAPEEISKDRGLTLSQKITSDAADEFTEATGEILGATDDLAFVLAVFPDDFYGYMWAHPDVLDHWLYQAHETLFRGMPESLSSLAEFKRRLVSRVSKHIPAERRFISTRDKVLEMLKSAPVSAID